MPPTIQQKPIPIKDYLHKSGDTWGGDQVAGAYKLKFSSSLIKQYGVDELGIRNIGDTSFSTLQLAALVFYTKLYGGNAAGLESFNADDGYMTIKARDNGVGLAEIARLTGGATPVFAISAGKLTGGFDANAQAVANWGFAGGAPAKFKAGTYTGDGASAARQIAVGFLPKIVILEGVRDGGVTAVASFFLQNASWAMMMDDTGTNFSTVRIHLHASDGFVVADGADWANKNAETYRYVAFG